MSTFRDNVRHELVTVSRHPLDVYDILGVLQEALRHKAHESLDDGMDRSFVSGMQEQWAFVANLRADVAQEYGYKEGAQNGVVRGS